MTVRLPDHLDLIAGAPGGIGKLRRLILELAVRGKLVPQDPNDEPASKLLKRIAQERAQLEADGLCKKSKATPLVGDDEQPFKIPSCWEWIRLGDAVEVLDSRRKPVTKDQRKPGPYPYYGASGIVDYVSEYLFDEDLVLVGEDGAKWGAGDRTAFSVSGKTWVNNHAHVLRPNRSLLTDSYLIQALVARDLQPFITGTTVPKLNQAKLVSIEVPVPPLAEQHRIVAKVDELMALCDRLEAEQTDAGAAHVRLVETLLGTLTQSANAAELAANWQRLAGHFDTLFTTESSLDALKQTVLQLAVMGKLVPQDPNDEPASELLKRIAQERARLEAEGVYKKSKAMPLLGEDERPFAVPGGWAWVRFDEIINPEKPISYGVLVPGPEVSDGVPFVRIADLSIAAPPDLPEKTIDRRVDGQYSRTRLDGGEVLMGVVGSIGKLGVAPLSWKGANIARAICRIVPTPQVDRSFVLLLLQSKLMQSSFLGDTRTLAQPTLNVGLIRSAFTPIPPLAEQHRIVAKVDELMALVDRLKADLAESRRRQERLASTLIDTALAAA